MTWFGKFKLTYTPAQEECGQDRKADFDKAKDYCQEALRKRISVETVKKNFEERKYQDFLDSYKDLCTLRTSLSAYIKFATTEIDEEVVKGLQSMQKAVIDQVKEAPTKPADIQFHEIVRFGTWMPVCECVYMCVCVCVS
jgi:hypothetical protein